ncbi:MAG: argininosuccinate lyase [Deltaproteobacteria bacterium]|nr:argininosuccinate lyase [Deltaproteobacteria bacterium]
MSTRTPWGGRFSEAPDALVQRFTQSVSFDRRLAPFDIRQSIAHARMLGRTGILAQPDVDAIVRGLEQIGREVEAGTFAWSEALEDVHMNIEARLTELVGLAGARLHTARSRNDQVATSFRLWCKDAVRAVMAALDGLAVAILGQARSHVETLLPGYTHLQRAQPLRLAHHLLAWVEMLERDRGRFVDLLARVDECPLGSGALATTTHPIDREGVAHELGFSRPCRNSVDAVSSRDFALELLAACAIAMTNLSRIGEELVIWSSAEFGFVELSDAFATGSSIMPQKKNPDVPELVRGKTGRIVGDLVSLLVTVKGLPFAYDRDLQEDKEPVFDATDTLVACLGVLAGAIGSARFDAARMRAALEQGSVTATEAADYLVAKGVPFREAHAVVGALVARAVAQGTDLTALGAPVFRQAHPAFDDDVMSWLDPERAVERRDVLGGPARGRVLAALDEAEARLHERGDESSCTTSST